MPKLTDTAINNLKTPAKRIEIPDSGAGGARGTGWLYLVHQPTGSKSWAFRYRLHGVMRKISIGRYPEVSIEDAHMRVADFRKVLAKQEDPAVNVKQERQSNKAAFVADEGTFADLARLYLDEYCKDNQRQWRETARLLGLRADPNQPEKADDALAFVAIPGGAADEWKRRLIGKITQDDVRHHIMAIRRRGSPIAANRTLAAVRALFNWVDGNYRKHLPQGNPARGLKPPAKEVKRKRTLTRQEIRVFWKACEAIGWPFGPAAQLLLLTAARRDEVGAMRRPEITQTKDGMLWTIPSERAKNDETHKLPLSQLAAEIVKAQPDRGKAKLLFSTNSTTAISGWSKFKSRLDADMLALLKQELADAGEDADSAEIAPWRLHDLRRTASTLMDDELEVRPHIIEQVLNHVRKGDEARYNHSERLAPMRRALEAWALHVAWIVEGEPERNVVALRASA